MTPTLTIPEMALHMRRLVEGMLLDGHLRPQWALEHKPVRVGDELGWKLVKAPSDVVSLDDCHDEGTVSSERLHDEWRSRIARDRPGALEANHLIFRKQLPCRWNARAVEFEYFISTVRGWMPCHAAILELACAAMAARAGVPSDQEFPPGWVKQVGWARRMCVQDMTPQEAGTQLAVRLLDAWAPLNELTVDLSDVGEDSLVPEFFEAFTARIAQAGERCQRELRGLRWEGISSERHEQIRSWTCSDGA